MSNKKNTSKTSTKNKSEINSITFLLVEKCGEIKEIIFNNFDINELYKKCGFRKSENFICRNVWKNIKIGKNIHNIEVWSRNDGKSNTENKYDFPPPIDKELYFGNCAILGIDTETNNYKNLTKDLWNKIYETLFGKFEDLNETYENDEDEEDELLNMKKELKIKKTGYLKDGFVVDSDEEANEDISNIDDEDKETEEETDESTIEASDDDLDIEDDELIINEYEIEKKKSNKNIKNSKNNKKSNNIEYFSLSKCNISINNINEKNINTEDIFLDDITNGSELTFEEYDY